ncbi:QacE family quaternary ammonium compound efflux SMR transporter [Elizabethkingia anophelis]|uniref:DMT family transporter n=1 Tax=Elizabethkingia anophelis TaxID=1117645 RepID=UPI0021A31822|nr:multidrug efflux SMR transporter [Elizabethkingia anophelis]MCT3947626.1 multidrug efflux SMR transporter [Elizabethkingia anophelis]MDV3574586.1 QacE family quaternary ammonium compound efflux SMR transporter [Elizabethkingia anophelis]MDV3597900.1 QacE family quaternary ammonium compound efflux SMR transporter [Elizabethkingia anophelis]MDV3607416.1 QacE family quaternary ammonium compound efflux SMR transporter [Elizabethkingia anophelis]
MKYYIFLAFAILFESVATSFLKASEGFTKPLQTGVFVVTMSISFYLLTQAIKVIPIGIAYAIWSAIGILLISLVGYFRYKEVLDAPAIIGMSLIVVGVVVINLFSKSAGH